MNSLWVLTNPDSMQVTTEVLIMYLRRCQERSICEDCMLFSAINKKMEKTNLGMWD